MSYKGLKVIKVVNFLLNFVQSIKVLPYSNYINIYNILGIDINLLAYVEFVILKITDFFILSVNYINTFRVVFGFCCLSLFRMFTDDPLDLVD